MKYLIVIISSCLMLGCGVAGFQSPRQYFVWYLHNVAEHFDLTTTEGMVAYSKKEAKDMRACGMDPVIGEGGGAKAALCLEGKGWYLKTGPACEDQLLRDDPLCVKWRTKHKR